ncbi:histidine phosphatase family protein [Xylophilus sp.]|uniref:histidine phosphatase family protein n=1 Tax=Xylophilus sp. TaxID=2653893 RepID=UPI0013BA7AD6|nr:histidine phosphatase family protein [Xylophilus sp.]KAF1049520.1 MAG: putative phosphoserine phosphatase 2 [Xylophilus sp.]
MTELILIRHGETDWNRELRFQGQLDVPLNATGLEQARRVAERLAGEAADHLVTSDLIRTRQTALPVLATLLPQLPIDTLTDAALREQHFGIAEGLRTQDVERDHADAWLRWRAFRADSGMPGGETTREFHARVTAALQRIAAAYPKQKLVVVTHGGVLDMVWRTASGQGLDGPRQSHIPNAGISRVQVDGGAFRVLDWGDTRHLEGLGPQPVYDQQTLALPAATA